MTSVLYATREEVAHELDFKESARANHRIDRALANASRAVEGLTHRRFYPEARTVSVDWPNSQRARPWRLWLDANELISVTTLTSGGTTIDPADYFLRRGDDIDEPPYSHIEIDLGSNAAFGGGTTHQRDITIVGVFGGCRLDETNVGATAEALDATETTVDVTGPASALLGVGSILRVDTERMLVTGRSMLDTGQNLATPLTNLPNNQTVTVTDGTGYAVGETILLDAERMRIDDIAGNNLVVTRAWDGSTIAAHSGSDIYAARTLTVTRGALGTTAAAHDTAAPVYRFDPPAPVRSLTIAEALNEVLQGSSGWARTVGSGENQREAGGKGIADLRKQVYVSHGRKARTRAV